MNTKTLLASILVSVSASFYAQETPSLEKQIRSYTHKIDSIVTSEKEKMNSEMEGLEAKHKSKTISDEELKNQKQEVALRYENIINDKVDAERTKLDSITQETVKYNVFEKDGHMGSKRHPKEYLKNQDGVTMSFGFLNTVDKGSSFDFFNNNDEVKFGKAMSSSLDYRRELQLGSYTSPIFFRYGLGFRFDTYKTHRPKVFAQDGENLFLRDFTEGTIKKNRTSLNIQYVQIPLDISFVLNPKYIEYEGEKYLDMKKNQLRLGVGVYGGYRIGNQIQYKYSNLESSKNTFSQRVENGINPFLFGGKLSLSYGGFSLYVKKDFTKVFDERAMLNNKNSLQFGLELINLEF